MKASDDTADPADGRPPGRTLRLLHTSDVHVGETEGDVATLASVVEVAAAQRADAVLVVGDLFDHNRVKTPVVEAVAALFARLEVPVVILPGNHDSLVSGGVYDRVAFPANVRVIDEPSGHTVTFTQLDLDVWGRPHTGYDDFTPLRDLPARGASTWQVALAHGHLVRGGDDLRRAYLITTDEIASSDRDYVALGHWDVAHAIDAGPVPARYCGSPSRTSVCAVVTLSLSGNGTRTVTVESVAL